MTGPLLLTPGMGIGPEVSLAALAARPELWPRVVLIGGSQALYAVGSPLPLIPVPSPRPVDAGLALFDPGDEAEPVEVAAIRLGALACLRGQAHALITGPIHKARLAARGFAWLGHTDLLGDLCGARPVMAFVGGRFGVALVTVHLPLSAVPAAIRAEAVEHTVRVAALAWRDQLGVKAPRVGVCGLNPHAGEDGLLGREEIEQIAPACERLLRAGSCGAPSRPRRP